MKLKRENEKIDEGEGRPTSPLMLSARLTIKTNPTAVDRHKNNFHARVIPTSCFIRFLIEAMLTYHNRMTTRREDLDYCLPEHPYIKRFVDSSQTKPRVESTQDCYS